MKFWTDNLLKNFVAGTMAVFAVVLVLYSRTTWLPVEVIGWTIIATGLVGFYVVHKTGYKFTEDKTS